MEERGVRWMDMTLKSNDFALACCLIAEDPDGIEANTGELQLEKSEPSERKVGADLGCHSRTPTGWYYHICEYLDSIRGNSRATAWR
jgi:hypothetical protein